MGRLPVVTGPRMVAFLARQGFRVVRAKGSHVRVAHPDGRATTVPVHARRELPVGTVLAILRDIDLGRSEFLLLWEA